MKQVPLYEQIYNTILHDIENQVYRSGERLPSEKEISELYHVSRITSKKAMSMLAEKNKIIRLPGKGSFVTEEGQRETREPEKKKLIGVILDGFSPSFACTILRSIQEVCDAEGYSMVLRCSNGSLAKETRAIEELVALGVSGFIIMCVHDENYNERILQLVVEHFPVVTIDRQLKGIPVPFVGTDNVSAAREMTAYLLAQGMRRISFVQPKAHETITLMDRQKGFQLAFNDYGLIADESLWITSLRSTLPETMTDEYLQKDIEIVTRYLEEHKDVEGFMASEYNLAKILKYCLVKLGKYREGMIVCFDGPELFLSEPEFTYVAQGEEEIGRTSMALLLEKIKGEECQKAVIVPYHIRKRSEEITEEVYLSFPPVRL